MECQSIKYHFYANAFEIMHKLKLKESSICVRTFFYLFVFEAVF